MSRRTAIRAIMAVAILLVAGEARGQGLSAQLVLQPSYVNSYTLQTDALGRETRTYAQIVNQLYRLSVFEAPWPLLRFTATGQVDWTLGWTRTNGLWTDNSRLLWNVTAVAEVGNPVLSGTLGYSIREQGGWTRLGEDRLDEPKLGQQSVTGSLNWRPDELALVQVQAVHSHTYDGARSALDRYGNSVYALAQWTPVRPLTLRYSFGFASSRDEVVGVDEQSFRNSGYVSFNDKFFSDFLSVSLIWQGDLRNTHTTVTSPGATVEVQRLPVQGLSLVDAPPAVPERDTLLPNPALIDGNLQASAGVDLGFAAGDDQYRNVGARFPDTTSRVNVLYVYVDRSLPTDVAQTFTWLAFASDDNATWAPVVLAGLPVFSAVFNRFEIPIAPVQVRFLKAATKPLLPGVTTDPRFSNVFVTEVQFFERTTGANIPTNSGSVTGTFTAGLLMRLLPALNLNYEFSAYLTHASGVGIPYYSIANALSVSFPISRPLRLGARIQRTDQGGVTQPTGSSNALTATLSYDPVPTFGTALTYNGVLSQGGYPTTTGVAVPSGTRLNNGLTLSARADLYPGVSVFGSAGYTRITGGGIPDQVTLFGTLATTIAVNPVLSFTASLLGSDIQGGPPGQANTYARVDGTVTIAPFPALYVNAGIGRYVAGLGPQTAAIVNASFSPFPGNDLQLRFGYNDNLDTGQDFRARVWGPGLRWNILRGTWVDATYSVYDNYTAALNTASRVFFVNLFITIG